MSSKTGDTLLVRDQMPLIEARPFIGFLKVCESGGLLTTPLLPVCLLISTHRQM